MKQTCGLNAIRTFLSCDNRWSVHCAMQMWVELHMGLHIYSVCHVYTKTEKIRQILKRNCMISNFTNICSTVLQLHAYTRTDGRTDGRKDSQFLMALRTEEKTSKKTQMLYIYNYTKLNKHEQATD